MAEDNSNLVAKLLKRGTGSRQAKSFPCADRSAEHHPLSYSQQRLWFLHQIAPTSSFYNEPLILEIEGALSTADLERALNSIVNRHEALRTVFIERVGEPRQKIIPPSPVNLTVEMCSIEPEAQIRSWVREPFELSQGPLIRFRLFKLSETHHVLATCMHHIICDGWSFQLFLSELGTEYRAARERRTATPLPSIQYVDYALWQRESAAEKRMSGDLAYWQKKLAGIEPLDLPLDRSRPPVQSHEGGVVRFRLPGTTVQRLKDLSTAAGATPFMGLLSIFFLLMHKYTGQADVAIGVPIANRSRPELEDVFGFFVNTLVIRSDLGGDLLFSELLVQIRAATLEAYAHQEVPFDKVVEAVNPERELGRSTLFQVMFNLHVAGTQSFESAGATFRLRRTEVGNAKLDLLLGIEPIADGDCECGLQYSSSIFDHKTAEQFAAHYVKLIELAVTHGTSKISEFDLGTQPAACEPPPTRPALEEQRIHVLFERQAARTPDAIALVCSDRSLSFGELNERANALAHELLSHGCRDEELVAVLLDRCPEMIVALLGILKAGCAYVPIDPESPPSRLNEFLNDSQARFVVSRTGLKSGLPPGNHQLLNISATETIAAKFNFNPPARGRSDSLVYALFTSGSTGKPKAALLEHRNLAHYCSSVSSTFTNLLGRDLAGLAFASVSTLTADLGNTTVFPSLLHGGTLHLIDYSTATDAELFATYLENHSIDVLKIVPSHFMALFQGACAASVVPRRLLVFGGEALPVSLVNEVRAASPSCKIVNHYGPTETCVGSLMLPLAELSSAELERFAIVPIGRPIGDTELLVLDRHGKPVPEGAHGELYIGGPGVARGYLGRDELTNQKFVTFSTGTSRFYRTGDLVRRRADGVVDFVGRIDDQVKIRGYRIELGEIEAALLRQADVLQAVVRPWQYEGTHQKELVAYFVGGASSTALAQALAEVLPEVMVPKRFVSVENIPRNANGKVDHRALPRPVAGAAGAALPSSFKALDGIEENLAKIWRALLDREPSSKDENFFHVGGHSLLATRLAARIRAMFSVKFSVKQIFQTPRFSDLAAELRNCAEAQSSDKTDSRFETLIPSELRKDSSYPLSFAQQRLWFLARMDPDSPYYNEPLAVRLCGKLDIVIFEQALTELLRRHESLRTVFFEVDGAARQRIGPPSTVKLAVAELSGAALLDGAISAFARMPFSLMQGPLYRFKLLRLGPCEHVFLLCFHHIVSDGWSIKVFMRELEHLYNARLVGLEATLVPIERRYVDYVAWQAAQLSGDQHDRQLAFWKKSLEDVEVLNLPFDRARPAQQEHRGARVHFEVPVDTSTRLKNLAATNDGTLFMCLLACYEVLLHRFSGQECFAIGVPVANRSHFEFEGLVGFFVNTLAMRADLTGDPSFAKLLTAIRQHALDAYQAEAVPFEKIVEAVRPTRDISHTPLFQVLFNLNSKSSPLTFQGITAEPIRVNFGTSKFDLSLDIEESADGALACSFEYDLALFDHESIEHLASCFRKLCESAVESPDQAVSRLKLLPETERRRILRDWNATAYEYPEALTIHGMIEHQCQLTPDAVALEFENVTISYAKLNRRANRLARHLVENGIGKDKFVGVCMDRSLEMVVALLGTVKAGGAYVPVDPSYPKDRVQYMFQDSGVKVVLTQSHLRGLAAECGGAGLKLIAIDEIEPELSRLDASNLDLPIAGTDLAYMIYTSGSTGRPKGAMNTHSGIYNRLMWMQRAYRLDHTDVVLQKTPFSFDVSVWEFFWPLMFGARLTIARPESHKDPRYLSNLIQSAGVTTLHFVPSMLHAFLSYDERPGGPSLRRIICSGEALPYELQELFFEKVGVGGCELHNLYGPTEAAVDVTYWACQSGSQLRTVPIGRPIDNIQIYILDAHLQPVPIGVAGELYIGGIGVARGYHNRTQLTAERFVPDPFGGPNARMYRTGDRSRYLGSGAIEYLGRLDNQVKLRGFRIELGEVETRLVESGTLARAIVLVQSMAGGQKALVAYVLPKDGARFDETALRNYLKGVLPEYMVPSVFVPLDTIPLSPNGKVDHRKLPAPQFSAPKRSDTTAQVLAGTLEADVAAVWREVLGLEYVGMDDNFFDLGGQSLLLLQIQSRLVKKFAVAIELIDMFRAPTVRTLAELIRGYANGITATNSASAASHIGSASARARSLAALGQRRQGGNKPDGEQ